MRDITSEQLAEILRLHSRYVAGEPDGVRADLRGANLREANLREANLRGANLSWANLSWANLRVAYLSWANLRGANLRGANLRGADLCGADLCGADLCGADLCGADLRGADLCGADLCGADLRGAIDGTVARLDFGGWSICVRATHTTIGCQGRDNTAWLSWSAYSPEIAAMHDGASEWWRVHGDVVKAAIRCVMAKSDVSSVSATKGEGT